MKVFRLVWAMTATSLPARAAAQSFDPSSYLQARSVEQGPAATSDGLRESMVTVKGVPYRVFRSKAGTLFLPRLDSVDKSELEGALCANQVPIELEKCVPGDASCRKRNGDKMTEEVTVIRAETPLVGNVVAYAELVGAKIRHQCGDVNPTYFAASGWRPELGLSWKGGSERQPTTYKIFAPGLAHGFGFSAQW